MINHHHQTKTFAQRLQVGSLKVCPGKLPHLYFHFQRPEDLSCVQPEHWSGMFFVPTKGLGSQSRFPNCQDHSVSFSQSSGSFSLVFSDLGIIQSSFPNPTRKQMFSTASGLFSLVFWFIRIIQSSFPNQTRRQYSTASGTFSLVFQIQPEDSVQHCIRIIQSSFPNHQDHSVSLVFLITSENRE